MKKQTLELEKNANGKDEILDKIIDENIPN